VPHTFSVGRTASPQIRVISRGAFLMSKRSFISSEPTFAHHTTIWYL
jgi:hypothetical protein